ncbi:MAG: VCBS repeat-containing protein [Nannocystaceae bacterium]
MFSARPTAGARIDVDGDGLDEIAVLASGADILWIAHTWRLSAVSELDTPVSLAVIDRDGDGLDDLVVASSQPPQLIPLRSRGDGQFDRGAPIALERSARDLTAHDLDGDGVVELLAADGDGVLVIRGDDVRRLDAGVAPIELELGDINSDGRLDIAVLDVDGALVVLLGDGAGGFTHASSLAIEPTARDLALADLDGDGALDALARVRVRGGFWHARGDGAGGFAAPQFVDIDSAYFGDGLVATSRPSGEGLASVTLAIGTLRTWFADENLGAAGSVEAPADDSGYFSLLGRGFAASANTIATVDLQTGATPIVVGEFAVAHRVSRAVLADLTGDGLADVAIADAECVVSIYAGDGGGGLAEEPLAGPKFASCTQELQASDINADGHVDLVAVGDTPTVQLALGIGNGEFALGEPLATPNSWRLQALLRDPDEPRIIVDGGEGMLLPIAVGPDATLVPEATLEISDESANCAAADLDGDGDAELIAATRYQVHVYDSVDGELAPMQAHVLASLAEELAAAGSWPELVAGDLDDDGVDEVVFFDAGALVVVEGLEGPAPSVASVFAGAPSYAVERPLLVDIDGDGTLDFAVQHDLNDFTFVRGNGSSFAGPTRSSPIGFVRALGDLDDDGRTDLLATSDFSGFALLRAEAREVTLPVIRAEHPLPELWEEPLRSDYGDFDGDGRVDIALVDARSRTVFWGDDAGLQTSDRSFIHNGDDISAARVADVDGDGRDELLHGYSRNGSVVGLSWDGGRLSWSVRMSLNIDGGALEDVAVADLDGDGRDDIAVAWGPTAEEPTAGIAAFFADAVEDASDPRLPFEAPRVLLTQPHPLADLLSVAPTEDDPDPSAAIPEVALQLADLDGDGRPELLLDGGVDGLTRLLWNDGARRFTEAALPGRSARILEPGVLLAIAGEELARHRVYGRRIAAGSVAATVGPRRLDGLTDCNADGVADLRLRGRSYADGQTARFMAGVDDRYVEYPLATSSSRNARCVDVDGDGLPDLVDFQGNFMRLRTTGAER